MIHVVDKEIIIIFNTHVIKDFDDRYIFRYVEFLIMHQKTLFVSLIALDSR